MKKEPKTIDLTTKVRNRKGVPFTDGIPSSPVLLGERLVFTIDGQAAGSVGDMRRAAHLAEKLSNAEQTESIIEISEKEIDTLKTILKGAAPGMRFDLYCSLSHLVDPEEEEFASIAKWYEGGASKGTKAEEKLAKSPTPPN